MKIIYLITKVVTYPGAFMKGFWEHITCRILKSPVRSRRYLRATEWCGHTEHDPANSPAEAWTLCLLPWFAQTLLGLIFLGASVGPLLVFGLRGPSETIFFWVEIIFLFLGCSMITNAFPAWSDAKRLWHLFYGKPTQEEIELIAAAKLAEETAAAALDQLMDEIAAEDAAAEDAAAEDIAEDDAEHTEDDTADNVADDIDEDAAEDDGDDYGPLLIPSAPKFAKLPAKILLAPSNVFFAAGAWLEHCGLTAIAAIAAIVLAIVLR